MNNKKNVIIIAIFIVVFISITAIIGISSHIPFIGKAFSLIFAIILIVFVILVFILAGRKNK